MKTDSPLKAALLEYRAKVTELERENAELKYILEVLVKSEEIYPLKGCDCIKCHAWKRAEALVANKRKIKELPEWSQ